MGEINATDTKKMRLHRTTTVNEAQIDHLEDRALVYASSSTPTNARWPHDLPFLRSLRASLPYQQPPLTPLRLLPTRYLNVGSSNHQRRARRHLPELPHLAALRHLEAIMKRRCPICHCRTDKTRIGNIASHLDKNRQLCSASFLPFDIAVDPRTA
jgi:hypothetical protein